MHCRVHYPYDGEDAKENTILLLLLLRLFRGEKSNGAHFLLGCAESSMQTCLRDKAHAIVQYYIFGPKSTLVAGIEPLCALPTPSAILH